MFIGKEHKAPVTTRRSVFRLETWLVIGPALIIWVIGALTSLDLPGVYMDAVNPDYMVVRLLNPEASQIPVWVLPGNLLFERFPVMIQIYHGALTYYIGLPFYAAFGTGILGIRIANMVFGLMVLIAAASFLRAFRVRPLIACLGLAGLAVDPGFLFSFRTQFYITLLPVAFVLWSAALVEANGLTPKIRTAFFAGLLAGVACYGYFIHAAFAPALLIFSLWRWHTLPAIKRLIGAWLIGFIVGILPYVVGLLLIMIATGGPAGFVSFMSAMLGSLGVQSSSLTCWARVRYFADLMLWTLSNVGPAAMMVGQAVKPIFSDIKILILLALPLFTMALGVGLRRRPGAALLLVAGFPAGFFLLVMCFGNRMWLHHAAPMLPVLYLAFALSLERLCFLLFPRTPKRAGLSVAVIAGLLIIFNLASVCAVFSELEKTGGVKLTSNAITRYATDSLRDAAPVHRFFPDWGVFMPFAMMTRGQKPFSTDFSPRAAIEKLCSGWDAEVVIVSGQPEERLADWIKAVDWGEPTQRHYNQLDGKPVLRIYRWRSDQKPAGACVDLQATEKAPSRSDVKETSIP